MPTARETILVALQARLRSVAALHSISRSRVKPASELMSAPSNPSRIGLPFRDAKQGGEGVEISMVRAGFLKAESKVSNPKNTAFFKVTPLSPPLHEFSGLTQISADRSGVE